MTPLRIMALGGAARLAEGPPLAAVTAGQAMRLLVLADGARWLVEEAAARAAGRAAADCARALAEAAGPLEDLAAELRDSLAGGRPARLGGAQAAAIEEFARCAAGLRR